VTHELGHILGIGTAASWDARVEGSVQDGYVFVGEHAKEAYGHESVPLDRYASHWAEGVMSVYNGQLQETAMDPSTPRGERQWMTELDYAGLRDIGWQVPEPAALVLLVSGGAGLLAWRCRK
jgi:hypothetical protein